MQLGGYRILDQVAARPWGLAYQARHGNGASGQAWLLPGPGDPNWKQLSHHLRAIAHLKHPATRRVLELGLDHHPPYVILADLPAANFAELTRGQPWMEQNILHLGKRLIEALREAHGLGITHGRISPATVYWSDAQAMLDFADFSPPPKPANDDLYDLGQFLFWLWKGQPAPPGWRHDDPRITGEPRSRLVLLLENLLAEDPANRPSANTLIANWELAESRFDQAMAERGLSPGATVLDQNPNPPTTEETDRFPETLGRFRLRELLGEGGLGQVFRAEDMFDGSQAAIKVLHRHLAKDPVVLRRFQKEARLLAEVAHPNVTRLLEVNQDKNIHYLALEFVDGLTLSDLLLSKELCPAGKLEEKFAIAITVEILRALEEPHRRGIFHRDLKPHNIMVRRGETPGGKANLGLGAIKLCDFGLARHVLQSESMLLTREGSVLGTPLYMSPEQSRGKADIDVRTDIYSLGATLYHLLAGRPPFEGDTMVALGLKHDKEPPPPPTQFTPELSEGIVRIVDRCLAKQPADRYLDAAALLDDLLRLQRGAPASIDLHPQLPLGPQVITHDWSWELESSPAALWPYVSNTERLNRAVGLPGVEYHSERVPSASGSLLPGVRRFGKMTKAGVTNAWREHPFEWIEGRRMGVYREFTQGIFAWFASMVELVPRPGGGCTLHHRVRLQPRGFLGRLVAKLEVGFRGRRGLERVYRRLDAHVQGQGENEVGADPFEAVKPLTGAGQRRLQQAIKKLVENGVKGTVALQLGAWLQNAADQEVARIRPLALAKRLETPEDELIKACLLGAREGLLVLLWDLVCPLCRIPAGIEETLKNLQDHGHCQACSRDFPLDFANSVEMIFRVHPDIRPSETKVYCIGGPAHSPHVVSQVRIGPGERFDLDVNLTAGRFRLRGPQLPHAVDIQIDPAVKTTRWTIRLPGDFQANRPEPIRLTPGGQGLAFVNDHDEELVVRVERSAGRDDALTAARASTLALFRELFPGEVLQAGQLVSIAQVTFLVAGLGYRHLQGGEATLFHKLGEARAFALVHDFFRTVDSVCQTHAGALIKTVSENALAAFDNPLTAIRAALEIGGRPARLRQDGLAPRLALHRGPAFVATINDRLDYFGETVSVATAMPQHLTGGQLALTAGLANYSGVADLLSERELRLSLLQGIEIGEVIMGCEMKGAGTL